MSGPMHRLSRRWSTYMAFCVWGSAGFMAQPTLASMVVHLMVTPIMLGLTIMLAHHEGKIT